MFADHLLKQAERLIELYRGRGWTLASAESCTGGLLAGLITTIPGSSEVFERGFVTYSNAAKAESLGVPSSLIESYGAVSREIAAAMAFGALAHSHAEVAVSVTGIAGPGGGSAEKPVGLVHFGCARKGGAVSTAEERFGDIGRSAVRLAAVARALDLLRDADS